MGHYYFLGSYVVTCGYLHYVNAGRFVTKVCLYNSCASKRSPGRIDLLAQRICYNYVGILLRSTC